MHRFWNTIIEPVLEKLQPKSIVEIGSDNGKNTRNLLEFCERTGATLHAVDPLPKFDVVDWQERYKDIFIFHQSLSLNAIPKIDGFDVILIDGDHNWYTVFNELRLIEKKCTNLKQPFPLVMLHDTGWPYGRRDLYYDPETIPPTYLKPYKKKGMKPGSAELLEKGGLNSHLCNAIYENDLQNGVLTAIEDFMEESEQELEFVKVLALHGLGILFPLQLKEKNAELQKFFKALTMSPVVAGFLEQVEKSLIEVTIGREEKGKALKELEATRKEEIESLRASLEERTEVVKAKDEELSQIKGALQAAEAAIGIGKEEARILQAGINKRDEELTDIQQDLAESKESEARQKEEIESLQASLEERAEVVKAKDEELSQIKGALQEAEAAIGIGKEEGRILQAGINERNDALKKKDEELTDIQRELAESKESEARQKEEIERLQSEIREQSQDIKQLIRWIEQLDHDIEAILKSRRWRFGNAIGELGRRVRFKPRVPMSADHLYKVLDNFHAWQRNLYKVKHDNYITFAETVPPAEDEEGRTTKVTYKKEELQKSTEEQIKSLKGISPDSVGNYAMEARFKCNMIDPHHREAEREAKVNSAIDYLSSKTLFFLIESLTESGGPSVVAEIVGGLAKCKLNVGLACAKMPIKSHKAIDIVDLNSSRFKTSDAIVATAWRTILRLNELQASGEFSGQKILFCQSEEPVWWSPETAGKPMYPGAHWHESALRAFSSPGFKHIIIDDDMLSFGEKYGFSIVGKVNVATPRMRELSPTPKMGPNYVVGFINRGDIWYKGRRECLEALRILRKRHPRLQIRAIGFIPEDGFIKELEVNYIQNPSPAEIKSFYNEIDVFISTSYIEGCPLPPQEAMWAGCPVVTTPIGVQGEYDGSSNAPTCIMVPIGDVISACDAVSTVLEDVELWNKLRYDGLKHIISRTPKRMVDDMLIALARGLGHE